MCIFALIPKSNKGAYPINKFDSQILDRNSREFLKIDPSFSEPKKSGPNSVKIYLKSNVPIFKQPIELNVRKKYTIVQVEVVRQVWLIM